jgi:hypothetical protein
MKKCLVVSFIISEFIFFPPSTLLGENQEHLVLGAHCGPSFGLFGKRGGDTHLGYDFQLYFSKRLGIQFEYFREDFRNGPRYFGNFVYKFREIINKKFQPYLSIGCGPDFSGWGETWEYTIKMGGGTKYRLNQRSSPLIFNLNSAIFFFLPFDGPYFLEYEWKRHVSIYLGLEIGL